MLEATLEIPLADRGELCLRSDVQRLVWNGEAERTPGPRSQSPRIEDEPVSEQQTRRLKHVPENASEIIGHPGQVAV